MELNKYIEHTLLKQDAAGADFEKLFREARENKFFGVCVNPAYVKRAKDALQGTDVKIVTVVGFPLGANKTEIKAAETAEAIKDGADEIDMVINVTALKDKDYDYIVNEVAALKKVCGAHNLKVIIETDLLSKDEIVRLEQLTDFSGANSIHRSGLPKMKRKGETNTNR